MIALVLLSVNMSVFLLLITDFASSNRGLDC